MIGCLPTQTLAFLAVFIYATHATQAIAFGWKPGLMPRLHQDTCRPETCIPDEQLVSRYMYMSTDTCCRIHVARPGYMLTAYLGDIITIHLCHGRLVSLCIQQQTGNKLATILSPIQDNRCWRQQLDTTCVRQHVFWCKRGITFHLWNKACILWLTGTQSVDFVFSCLMMTCIM